MRSFLRKISYWLLASCIIMLTISLYMVWYRYNASIHPEIIKADPFFYAEELPLEGWLVWDEEMINSPSSGIISYTYPGQIVKVSRGAILGHVRNGERISAKIKAVKEGYFIPATDGTEGTWNYPFLWNSFGNISEPHLIWYRNEGQVRKDQTVGKIVYQPQRLKCVAFADLTPELEKDLKDGRIRIKHDPLDLPREIRVRVYKMLGTHKVQIYLDLPFFPLDIIGSRRVSYTLYTGEKAGVIIPESCLVMKNGIEGVYRVKGNYSEFKRVEGMPLDAQNYFVSRGLKPGNLVILKGSKAREGRIKLW